MCARRTFGSGSFECEIIDICRRVSPEVAVSISSRLSRASTHSVVPSVVHVNELVSVKVMYVVSTPGEVAGEAGEDGVKVVVSSDVDKVKLPMVTCGMIRTSTVPTSTGKESKDDDRAPIAQGAHDAGAAGTSSLAEYKTLGSRNVCISSSQVLYRRLNSPDDMMDRTGWTAGGSRCERCEREKD